ncbi:MAG: hypothetical protein LVR00_07735 [Rhabdochlamydiaceae bacterium]
MSLYIIPRSYEPLLGITATNTLDIIDALEERGVFIKSSASLLKESVATIYNLRVALHLSAGQKKKASPPSRMMPKTKNSKKSTGVFFAPSIGL